jgi:hypothetical protein
MRSQADGESNNKPGQTANESRVARDDRKGMKGNISLETPA